MTDKQAVGTSAPDDEDRVSRLREQIRQTGKRYEEVKSELLSLLNAASKAYTSPGPTFRERMWDIIHELRAKYPRQPS